MKITKLEKFEIDDDGRGKVMLRSKPGATDVIQIQDTSQPGTWIDLEEKDVPLTLPDSVGFAYTSGSRWVYINGRWYYIP